MAEATKERSALGTIVVLVLLFGLIFLSVRVSTVVGERNVARREAADLRGKCTGLEDERDRSLDALRTTRQELQAAEAQTRIERTELEEARDGKEKERAALAAELEARTALLAEAKRARDEAERARLALADRQADIEAALVGRERELAEAQSRIRQLANPTPVEIEMKRLASPDPRVRADAVRSLGELRGQPGALDALRGALRTSPGLPEAQAVLRAAGPDAGRLMLEEAGDESVTVRSAIADETDDAALLGRLLDDPDPRVRAAAARRTGEARVEGALDALRRRRGDGDVEVRAAVAFALTRLGAWDDALGALADPDLRVARSALAGFTAADRPIPEGVRVHPDLAEAVALSRWILSLRASSD